MCVHQNRDKGEKIENDKKKKPSLYAPIFLLYQLLNFATPLAKPFLFEDEQHLLVKGL
jgi:hypothetical protein